MYVPNMYKATTWLAMFNYTCFLCFGVCAQVLLQQSLPEPDLLDPEEQSSGADSRKGKRNSSLLPTISPMSESASKYEKVKMRRKRLGLLLAITLAAHNFPEGLAVAVSSLESTRFGFVMTFVIAMHNIPEGMCIAVPICSDRKPLGGFQNVHSQRSHGTFGGHFALYFWPIHRRAQ